MKFWDEGGQTLVLTAVCTTVLVGFLAVAVDIGTLFDTRRQLQTAADAAATAAALQYLYVYNGDNSAQSTAEADAITAGNAAATANLGGSSPSVTVNANANSPAAHKGCVATTCYFEAVVSVKRSPLFFRAFYNLWQGTPLQNGITVSARAVAGTPSASSNCIYLTDQSGSVYSAHGKYAISASTCGLYVNSTSSTAMTGKGNSGSIDVSYVDAVGSTSGYTVNFPSGTNVYGNTIPQTIPFSEITPPTQPATCVGSVGGTQTLTGTVSPGCYNGTVNIGSATLSAGLYFFTGDVNFNNGAVTGTGVTLDINSGTLTVKPGNAAISLTAPTSGDGTNGTAIDGVAIYQPTTNSNSPSFQAGSSNIVITGYVYAPSAQISVQDNGGSSSFGGLVVDSIASGPSTINVTGYSPATSAIKTVALVE